MIKLGEKIEAYLGYLESIDLLVSIHFTKESILRIPYRIWQKLLKYNSHNNPFCISVKAEHADACIVYQRALIDDSGFECEIRECHAGVREYIFKVKGKGADLGYVAVSGYKGSLPASTAHNASAASLKSVPMPEGVITAVIPPLCIMLEELLSSCDKLEANEFNMMSQFLAENHTSITFDTFCSHFSRSKSYISHKFKKIFGMSFSDYCNELRLEDAKRLLIGTDLPITDIAFASGFSDTSYFIKLFKAKHGTSPLRFRQSTLS